MPSQPLGGLEELEEPITVQHLRDYLDVQAAGAGALLQGALDGAFGRCQRYTSRQLTPLPGADDDPDTIAIVRRSRVPRRHFSIPDARELTSVLADGVAVEPESDDGWGDTGYVLRGHPDEDADPAPTIELPDCAKVLKVTGKFGFDPFPDDLRDSVLKFAARGYREAKAQFGDNAELPEGGVVSYFRQVPAAVKLTWDQYRYTTPIFIA